MINETLCKRNSLNFQKQEKLKKTFKKQKYKFKKTRKQTKQNLKYREMRTYRK